jgi:hypothetical protein
VAAVIRSPSGSCTRSASRLLRPRRLRAGPPGLSHHASPGRLPRPGCGVATCSTWTISMAGLSPAGSQPCRLLLPAFGVRPFAFRFTAAHLGGSGSYHLSVTFPPPLTVCDTSILLTSPQTAANLPDEPAILVHCSAEQETRTRHTDAGDIELYTQPVGRTARFYVSGPRTC